MASGPPRRPFKGGRRAGEPGWQLARGHIVMSERAERLVL